MMPDIKPFTVIDPSATFGAYSVVWHFTTVGFGVKIGDNAMIGSHCYIGNYTAIGDECRIQTGVFLPNNSVIGNRVFIGPHVCFTDDRYPRVNNKDYIAQPPVIEDDVSIGAGAVILPGVTLGQGSMVGAGTVVTRNVPHHTTIRGTPGHVVTDLIKKEMYAS
jgi:UDP-2-acetamido-3-amino-2,3-dideoxy-glucuronate N-acetyltransferase